MFKSAYVAFSYYTVVCTLPPHVTVSTKQHIRLAVSHLPASNPCSEAILVKGQRELGITPGHLQNEFDTKNIFS